MGDTSLKLVRRYKIKKHYLEARLPFYAMDRAAAITTVFLYHSNNEYVNREFQRHKFLSTKVGFQQIPKRIFTSPGILISLYTVQFISVEVKVDGEGERERGMRGGKSLILTMVNRRIFQNFYPIGFIRGAVCTSKYIASSVWGSRGHAWVHRAKWGTKQKALLCGHQTGVSDWGRMGDTNEWTMFLARIWYTIYTIYIYVYIRPSYIHDVKPGIGAMGGKLRESMRYQKFPGIRN